MKIRSLTVLQSESFSLPKKLFKETGVASKYHNNKKKWKINRRIHLMVGGYLIEIERSRFGAGRVFFTESAKHAQLSENEEHQLSCLSANVGRPPLALYNPTMGFHNYVTKLRTNNQACGTNHFCLKATPLHHLPS